MPAPPHSPFLGGGRAKVASCWGGRRMRCSRATRQNCDWGIYFPLHSSICLTEPMTHLHTHIHTSFIDKLNRGRYSAL
jgi:hypothetical protein